MRSACIPATTPAAIPSASPAKANACSAFVKKKASSRGSGRWEQAGFQYDSTLSYADRPGFRCGTCHPYPMFDPMAQRPLRLIQRPLIAMECSVIAPRYLGLGYGPAYFMG